MSINTELSFYYKLLKGFGSDSVNTNILSVLGSLGYTGSINNRLSLSGSAALIQYLKISDGTYLRLSDGSFAYI